VVGSDSGTVAVVGSGDAVKVLSAPGSGGGVVLIGVSGVVIVDILDVGSIDCSVGGSDDDSDDDAVESSVDGSVVGSVDGSVDGTIDGSVDGSVGGSDDELVAVAVSSVGTVTVGTVVGVVASVVSSTSPSHRCSILSVKALPSQQFSHT